MCFLDPVSSRQVLCESYLLTDFKLCIRCNDRHRRSLCNQQNDWRCGRFCNLHSDLGDKSNDCPFHSRCKEWLLPPNAKNLHVTGGIVAFFWYISGGVLFLLVFDHFFITPGNNAQRARLSETPENVEPHMSLFQCLGCLKPRTYFVQCICIVCMIEIILHT